MAYDADQARHSRVVVDTPTERREFVRTQSVHTPDRSSVSAGMIGVLVVVAIALITMLVLFWMSNRSMSDQNENMVAQQPPPPVVQQAPAQQPPVIIQQPAPITQPAPIIVSPPAGGTIESSAPANDDATIQMNIDKQLAEDPVFSTLGVTATVINGKVTLVGIVKTEALKSQVEKMIRKVKGVKEVDDQISVVPE